ncbi:PP2C27 [Symbiodinium natans]|uniref:PP2C27 protein n=1 Tax=Symbiodinium natans TaxID=878477 RepID=A0A812TWE4_9DINO|nr:PP2C27 [Symbiodinium natans]
MWWLLSQLCTCFGRDKQACLLPEEESGGGSEYGYAVAKNERSRMEDAVDIQEDVAGYRLFAAYDGHAGCQAVTVAKEIIPGILGRYLRDAEDVEGAIKAAFRAADEEIMKHLVDKNLTPHMKTSSGTVACLALVKGAEMWIANLGDCRAMLSKDGSALAISRDHAPEKNAAEAERLRQLGVKVEGGYVEEHVAVSRAFGNVCFDTGSKVKGISNEPEVFLVEIDDTVDFVIIGTDGIWDALKEQFALTHARKALRTTAKPEDAAAAILQNAGKVSKSDNAAVIVVVFKFPEPLPKRLGVPRVSLTQLQETPA